MTQTSERTIVRQFAAALGDCRRLYRDAARLCVEQHPHLVKGSPDSFLGHMDDLHKGLLAKVFFTVVKADRRFSPGEQQIAALLIDHLWHQSLEGETLREACWELSEQAARLSWYSLVRPFDQVAPLRGFVGELETVVMRVANLVARIDGPTNSSETAAIKDILHQIQTHLRPLPLDAPGHHEQAHQAASAAVQAIEAEGEHIHAACRLEAAADTTAEPPPAQRLDDALRELDELIGLDDVKREVRTLTNFLRLQQRRRQAGLPQTSVSLHMTFVGNPGTGKTSVARIVGRIFAAMGVVKKGHLVETDRAGLVADFAGQTAGKTHKKIDEALDGVLFIDEAYSLVSEQGQDAYGQEALAVLLKRIEDDRERLVVILAGYPAPIERLLQSNPGLSSRISRQLVFSDYGPVELGRIFQLLCDRNHYRIGPEARARLLWAFDWMHRRRDEHFGNGRLVRNTFELAIRHMANRVAEVAELDEDLLTSIEAQDIVPAGVPDEVWAGLDLAQQRFAIACPGCGRESRIRADHLGRRFLCQGCQNRFTADWGEVVC